MNHNLSNITFRHILRINKQTYTIRKWSKLSYIHNVGTEPLRPITIGMLLEESALKFDRREALVEPHQTKILTFKDSLEQADKLAAGLRMLGLEKGDRVGIWAPNLVEWYITYMACARAGFVVVTLNPAYQASEIKYCVNKVGMKALVCADGFKNSNFYDILKQINPHIEKAEPSKMKCDDIPSLQNVIFISKESHKGTYHFEEIMEKAEESIIKSIKSNQHLIDPDMGCNIQFTSGTTGFPKATLATHLNIVNNSYYTAKRLNFDKKYHRICLQAPLFHALGSTITTMGALNTGSTIVLANPTYNPKTSLEILSQEGCTAIHGTPTMYVDLIDVQRKHNFKINLETAVIGGAPCSPQLLKDIKKVLKAEMLQIVYGLTETTAVVFQSQPDDGKDEYKAAETVGYICEHLETKVIDQNGNMVPFGTPGELCVRGYLTTLGYWGDDKKTKELIGQDKWMRTGDKFILQEDGYGKIIGRIKDMIIRGGENIFPKEIEDFLNQHSDILETHVIGVPHERLGEEICACIKIRENSKLNLENLIKFCDGKIASFKIPSQLLIVQEFPKTASGKIQKFKLQEMYNRKLNQ